MCEQWIDKLQSCTSLALLYTFPTTPVQWPFENIPHDPKNFKFNLNLIMLYLTNLITFSINQIYVKFKSFL